MLRTKEDMVIRKLDNTFSDIMRCEGHGEDFRAVLFINYIMIRRVSRKTIYN
jgi:hypothetical protein